MKVLHLTTFDLEKAGVAEVLIGLTKAQEELGIETISASRHKTAAAGHLRSGARCRQVALPEPGKLTLATKRALVNLVREENPDIIHAHGVYRGGLAAKYIQKKLKIPFVVTSHGDVAPDFSKRLAKPHIRKRFSKVLEAAACVTHLTEEMKEKCHDLRDTEEKSVIIPNGIDLDWWQARPDISWLPKSPFLLCIGRLNEWKGFDIAIQALKKVNEAGTPASLVIAGFGPDEENLINLAKKQGLKVVANPQEKLSAGPGCVVFTGYIHGDEKLALFNNAHAVLFPSQSGEAFGIVQLEAYAAGKAVIASDTRASRSLLVDGQNGFLLPQADVSAWADTIVSVLADNDCQRCIGEHNREFVKAYDWKAVAEQYQDVYKKVLESS